MDVNAARYIRTSYRGGYGCRISGKGRLKPFRFTSPGTIEEAFRLLAEDGARCLVGGSDLIVRMRAGWPVSHVVDLKRIAELMRVGREPGGISIGSAVSITEMARNPLLGGYPALVASARMIGSLQVQNRASVGGNVCNAAPSADAVPALICLDATAVIAGPEGRREQKVGDLFTGPGRTTLARGEVLVALRLPFPAVRSAACYLRFTPRREMDVAVAGAAAWLHLDDDGRIAEARIALASVGPTPLRAREAEACLVGNQPTATVFRHSAQLAAHEAQPISDTRGSADYRRELVNTLTARALSDCARQLETAIAA